MMNARSIVAALGGRWHGRYGIARCVAHEDHKPSLKLSDGNQGRLLVHCYVGCEPRDILAELRRRHLLDGHADGEVDRQRLEEQSHRVQAAAEEDRRRRTEWARRIWKEAQPAPGTLVELYLRSRGITIPIPPTLRFHAKLEYPETGRIAPAMVAGVQLAPDREIVGIHRTYLASDGSGKAFGEDSKRSLGPIAGGAVRLAKAKPGKWLAVAEGIENALSVQQASAIPAWAALSTSGIRSLELPSDINMVVICADHDANGAGAIAARAAAQRWILEGRRVRIAMPPTLGTDFNDLLQRGETAKIESVPHAA